MSTLFSLRPWKEEDAGSLVKYAGNKNVARNMTDAFPHPYTYSHAVNFIQHHARLQPVLVFAIEVNGEAAGSIGLHPQTDIQRFNAELGYWLGEPHWGKGIMSQAVKQMIAYGFSNLSVKRIFARPFPQNIASHKVLQKCGFTLEAMLPKTLFKNDEFIDEYIYAIRKPVD